MMAWVWFFLCLGLLIVVGLQSIDHRATRRKHEQCHQATVRTLTAFANRAVARAFRKAAEDYDSVAGDRARRLIAMDKAKTGAKPSIPALWLQNQAIKHDYEGTDDDHA